MKINRWISLPICVATVFFGCALTAQQTSAPAKQSKASAETSKAASEHKPLDDNQGERVFAANCARCHTSPDGFSQHISGTVVRHMRMRASLSEEEEKALLHFFNP